MEPKEFAYTLLAWLPPGVLTEAMLELTDPQNSNETGTLIFKSHILRSGHEGSLSYFVNMFLENFHLPRQFIKLAELYRDNIASEENIQLLETIRFSGSVEFIEKKVDKEGIYTIGTVNLIPMVILYYSLGRMGQARAA